ncbi:sulfurtransferase [Nisaea acidiphila]|uniref:Sulfurtransferase n=1 Tax=Nisaea acidiphila TaxID=1862145 RepID=A0A9J7B1J1_9PROT|nr:sulfurtransferase [Nisaea acidiphila]UUX51533.1 sulfurtransferase [Nisaea acidiphila]
MKKLIASLFVVLVMTGAVRAETVTPLVDADWAAQHVGTPGVVFLDVRGKLSGASKADYVKAHIPGAIWTNYLKDGWRTQDGNGTIAQLSTVETLETTIGDLGIENEDHVVIVAAGNSALDMGTATRIYWTFKIAGHDAVSILDGGMRAYTAKIDEKTKQPVNPLESGEIKLEPTIYTVELREEMLVAKADMAAAATAGEVIVDNRPQDQFLGINKHGKAKRAGTIPGALNLPENWLTENGGSFRDRDTIAKLYKLAGVPAEGAQISFCNTGHWASLGWFVSREILGNTEAKMYDGSMVEWSADPDLPVESELDKQIGASKKTAQVTQ